MVQKVIDHWVISLVVLAELWGWQQEKVLQVNGVIAGTAAAFVIGWVVLQALAYRRQGLPVPRLPDLIKQLWLWQTRAFQVKKRWARFCTDNGWGRQAIVGQQKAFKPMKLYRLVPAANGDLSAVMNPALAGVNPEKVWATTDYLADMIGCREVILKKGHGGTLKIKFVYSEPLARVLPIAQLPLASKGHIAYGVREDGTTAEVAVDLHILIGGMTRQGKSSTVHTMIADCHRQEIPLNLYVSDPKGGSEFGAYDPEATKTEPGTRVGNLAVKGYAKTDKSTQEMLEKAVEAMRGRYNWMARRGIRKITKFDQRNPLTIIVLDEFLALPGVIKQAAGGPLGQLLSQGAAAGFLVIGLAQIGHAETLKTIRNMFPQVICFKVPNVFTQDTFLGPQSSSRGGKCYQLDGTNHRGVGYSGAEHESSFTRYRAALCTDNPRQGKRELSDIRRIAAGVMPLGMEKTLEGPEEKRSARYIAWGYENEHGARRLLYIGKSNAPALRIEQHIADPSEPWWSTEDDPANEVDPVATFDSIRWFDSEKKALAYERKLIKQQAPKYNSVHNEGNPARAGKDQRRKVQLRIVKDEPETVEVAVDQVLDPVPAIEQTASEGYPKRNMRWTRSRATATHTGAKPGPVDYEGEREHAVWGE